MARSNMTLPFTRLRTESQIHRLIARWRAMGATFKVGDKVEVITSAGTFPVTLEAKILEANEPTGVGTYGYPRWRTRTPAGAEVPVWEVQIIRHLPS